MTKCQVLYTYCIGFPVRCETNETYESAIKITFMLYSSEAKDDYQHFLLGSAEYGSNLVTIGFSHVGLETELQSLN